MRPYWIVEVYVESTKVWGWQITCTKKKNAFTKLVELKFKYPDREFRVKRIPCMSL